MSGESAPKHRLVLCPKCRRLLQEFPDYDVYKCGGCGTVLQAKKRRSGAVNPKSGAYETVAAPRNALDRVSDDKQYSKGEQIVTPQENDLRVKPNCSSSEKCSLDGNNGTSQIENGECNGEQAVIPQNDLREKETNSSSGECSLDRNDGRGQTENSESNDEQRVLPQKNGLKEKTASSSSLGECSLDGSDRRGPTESGESNVEQLVLPQENGLKEKEASSSSLGKHSLDGNNGRHQIENGECNGKHVVLPQENGLKEKAASSSSLGERSLNGNDGKDQLENGKRNGEQVVLSLENGVTEKATRSSSGKCSLDGNDGRDQIEDGECNGEQLGPFILSDEELEEEMDIYKLSDRKHRVSNKGSSNELSSREIKASSELIVENTVDNANDTNVQLAMEELSNENMSLKGAGEELISALHEEDSNNDKLALVDAKPEVDITGINKAEAERELNLGASDRVDPKKDQSALLFAKSEVDTTGSASTFKRSSTENFLSEKGNIAHRKLEGTSDNVASPNKQWRQAQKSICHSFDSVRHVDTFDATEVINPSSELSGTLGELSKSPTTRSSHTYDGSVSSNDGVDELFLTQHLDSFENTYTESNGVSEGRSRKGKGLVDSMLYGNLDAQHQSYLASAKDRRGNQNQVPETTRHGHPHWTRTKGHEFPYKMPFHRSGSQSGYESGSPSNQTQDELYGSSSFLSPDSRSDPEEENLKLLRMFYKLQDQVNRTRYANGETHGRLSTDSYKGKHISAYHSHDFHDGRFYHGLDYPKCDGRCGHRINWRQRHNFPHQYLAEATRSSNHVDRPCFRCCPQEWQCSAELPPHVLHQHAELSKYHLGHNCCSSHLSLPSSPQWLMSSELAAYGHEIKSGDQRHMAPEVKNYLREKQNLNKRHYRPVAGGAPFVICHKCSKLLQLPADFLLFKKVCHWLKCGACSEVLKFSLQNRSHIVSYAPNALGPPPSDLNHQNEVITGGNLNSASHANYDHSSHAEPISYSDDYSHSVSKSYSSEGDPVSLTPQHPLHGNEHDKPIVSRGTFEPITEEKIASRVPSMSGTTVGTDDVALHSANVPGSEKLPSEIEAMGPPKSSPLHQLMGYSSPSQVLRGVNSSVEGKETRFKVENDRSSQQN